MADGRSRIQASYVQVLSERRTVGGLIVIVLAVAAAALLLSAAWPVAVGAFLATGWVVSQVARSTDA